MLTSDSTVVFTSAAEKPMNTALEPTSPVLTLTGGVLEHTSAVLETKAEGRMPEANLIGLEAEGRSHGDGLAPST